MSVTIGEVDSQVEVEGGAGETGPGPEPLSHWVEQERHDAAQRHAHELRLRTAAGGFDD